MTAHPIGQDFQLLASMQRRKLVAWIVLSTLVALLTWFAFRAYLNPELLFHFTNGLYC